MPLPVSAKVITSVASLSPAIKSMPAERFLDTNILLYGYDLDSPEKRSIAQSLIEQAWLQPGRTAIDVALLL